MKIAGRCQHSILQSVFLFLLPLHAQHYHVCLEQSDYYNSGILVCPEGSNSVHYGLKGFGFAEDRWPFVGLANEEQRCSSTAAMAVSISQTSHWICFFMTAKSTCTFNPCRKGYIYFPLWLTGVHIFLRFLPRYRCFRGFKQKWWKKTTRIPFLVTAFNVLIV